MINNKKHIGEVYNRLTIIDTCDNNEFLLCECRCGVIKKIRRYHIITEQIKSCGCLQREKARDLKKKHGMSNTKIYSTWLNIKNRCNDKNNDKYKNYGGRGIKICKRWMKFENFLYDMGGSCLPGLSIDRIDNDGNYTKENCRWVTQKEQCENKRNNIKYQGVTATEASRMLGGYEDLVSRRIRKGWSVKKAFTTQLQNN